MPRALAAAALTLALATAPAALATFMMPTDMPVGRVVANLQKYTQERPGDARGHYTLGRAHALAFTLKKRSLAVFEYARSGGGPKLQFADGPFSSWGTTVPGAQPPPDAAELNAHLYAALRSFDRALVLDPKAAETQIGLAYLLDAGCESAAAADRLPVWPGPVSANPVSEAEIDRRIDDLGSSAESTRGEARTLLLRDLIDAAPRLHARRDDPDATRRASIADLLREYWRRCAAERYARAFDLTLDKDSANQFRPMLGLSQFVSYEAGHAIVRLSQAGVPTDASRLERVQAGLAKLEKLPDSGAITPIVFDLAADRPLDDLIDPSTIVPFDLDGTGRPQRWPWVRPGTSILVWDPERRGRITSGRQLFGTATWYMFFTDGYRAMDALDDDRDGWLRGGELAGLAAWNDGNGNAVSDPHEVTPLDRLGVVGLAVRPTGQTGDSPMHARGLELADGRVLPTYDWVAHRAPPASDAPATPTDRLASRQP